MEVIFLCVLGLFIILTIAALAVSISNAKKLKKILRYTKRGKLDDTIEEYFNKVNKTAEEVNVSAKKLELIEKEFRNAFQKLGIVRFDMYPDLRGSYSFCIALLNRQNNGFIITSLYGRENSSTYIKIISDGKADVKLMNEEQEAVRRALNAGNETSRENENNGINEELEKDKGAE